MIVAGHPYTRPKLKKLRFLMTGNTYFRIAAHLRAKERIVHPLIRQLFDRGPVDLSLCLQDAGTRKLCESDESRGCRSRSTAR
jgi:hypothetical protein